MDERTRIHLRTTSANREYALTILMDDNATTTQRNWAAVAAFYAAMHAVNAYLWEIARLEPANHRDRREIMIRWPALHPLRISYNTLFEFSVRARYEPGIATRTASLNTLVNRHHARRHLHRRRGRDRDGPRHPLRQTSSKLLRAGSTGAFPCPECVVIRRPEAHARPLP